MSAPLNAFCLMPDNNAAHLDFMTGVLGLRVKRAEESFLAFDTSGVVVCLWESGHVCGQLGYRTNTVADCAATAILTLEMPGETAVTQAVAAGIDATAAPSWAGPSNFLPSTTPLTSSFTPPSAVRQAPAASKFSSARPSGSVILWQPAHMGSRVCAARRSRAVR